MIVKVANLGKDGYGIINIIHRPGLTKAPGFPSYLFSRKVGSGWYYNQTKHGWVHRTSPKSRNPSHSKLKYMGNSWKLLFSMEAWDQTQNRLETLHQHNRIKDTFWRSPFKNHRVNHQHSSLAPQIATVPCDVKLRRVWKSETSLKSRGSLWTGWRNWQRWNQHIQWSSGTIIPQVCKTRSWSISFKSPDA